MCPQPLGPRGPTGVKHGQVKSCSSFMTFPPSSLPGAPGDEPRTPQSGGRADPSGVPEGGLAIKMFILFAQVTSPLGLCSKEISQPETNKAAQKHREKGELLD